MALAILPPPLLPALFLMSAVVLAALSAYPLFLLLDGAVSVRALVSRGTLVLIVCALPWLIRHLGLTRQTLGLPVGARRGLTGLGSGFVLGVAVMAALVGMELAIGIRAATWPADGFFPYWVQASGKPLLVGCLVGVLEEFLFRGVLLGAVARCRPPLYAIATSAAYYATVHFFHSGLKVPASEVDWSSGLRVAGDAFQHLMRWDNIDSFLALFLAGLFLGCLRVLAPAGLAVCMGIHTGWVYVLRTGTQISDPVAASPWAFLVGNYDHTIGWLAASWLALLTLPLLWIAQHRAFR